MSQKLTFRPAIQADIPALGELARKIWCKWYPAIISQAQIEYMLQRMYAPENLQDQMLNLHHQFTLVFAGKDLVGYASVCTTDGKSYFIHKFYVDTESHQKGIGTQLLAYLEETYTPEVWELMVNRRNYIAINFYFKKGFTIKLVGDFDIGGGYSMDDFKMQKVLV